MDQVLDERRPDESHPAMKNEILRGLVGSTAHGINIVGQDDRDEMGVFMERPDHVMGLMPLDHYIWRTQPEGVRSGPGDLDLTLYSFRKFMRLAVKGNPTVLILLWLPDYERYTKAGHRLVSLRDALVSQEAGRRFLGYLTAQKMRLTGERTRTVNRPELVAAHGYDTKFAMHALRLGFEGIEYMTEGRLTLPVAEPNLSTLRAVRKGDVSFVEALLLIEDAERRLRAAMEKCSRSVNIEHVNSVMVEMHLDFWGL